MFFYCVLNSLGEVVWYSGIIGFELTEMDIKQLVRETKGLELTEDFQILCLNDLKLADNIMNSKKTTLINGEWQFEFNEAQINTIKEQINIQEELFKTQTELFKTQLENAEIGRQLFQLQTILIEKEVI